jgi:hypothetical protein
VVLFEHILGIRRHVCGVYGSRSWGKEMERKTGKVWPKMMLESPKDPQKSMRNRCKKSHAAGLL